MKSIVLTLSLLLTFSINAQTVNKVATESIPSHDDNQIYNTASLQVQPEYPGGMNEFYQYISKNFKVPNVMNLSGKVFVTFVVEKDGSLTEIKVIRDIGHGTGEEAIRVLKKSKKWLPAEQNGKKVRVQYSLPIVVKT